MGRISTGNLHASFVDRLLRSEERQSKVKKIYPRYPHYAYPFLHTENSHALRGGVRMLHIPRYRGRCPLDIRNRLAFNASNYLPFTPWRILWDNIPELSHANLFLFLGLFDNLGLDVQLTPFRSYASRYVFSGVQSPFHKAYHI